jgi:hypothetical protein
MPDCPIYIPMIANTSRRGYAFVMDTRQHPFDSDLNNLIRRVCAEAEAPEGTMEEAINQILAIYGEGYKEWVKEKEGTVGFVYEFSLNGNRVIMADGRVLSRIDRNWELRSQNQLFNL